MPMAWPMAYGSPGVTTEIVRETTQLIDETSAHQQLHISYHLRQSLLSTTYTVKTPGAGRCKRG
eukprot:CAMPEP_0170577062 /NCGR_PEP_ID=MMETSP0224-20130122/4723_1 /TAXON_ID=285029 /ORGANISM="Togula jolla, Strain CCCM 725" /LENGTH=63 /DNA_ID=CAMNT_0010899941 /DNA_START=237 /DNA_END=425 /DNA_ORIENTATION=-